MEKWRGAQRHLGIVEVDSEDPRSPPKVLLHQPEIEAEIQKFYKKISGVIANRIKKVLSNIISTDQCGFVDGRYLVRCCL